MQSKIDFILQRIAQLAAYGGSSTNPATLFARIRVLAEDGMKSERHAAVAINHGIRMGGQVAEGVAEIRGPDGALLWRLDRNEPPAPPPMLRAANTPAAAIDEEDEAPPRIQTWKLPPARLYAPISELRHGSGRQ